MSQVDDKDFATRALARLELPAPAPGLNHRLLAAYDGALARRPGWLVRVADLLWPGMPAWAPGAALGAALLLGVGAGLALPAPMAERTGFSLEEPPSASLESLMAEDE
jgi:hypothetical protein